MIQRLQSVYLLLAAALVITSMFMPMATIVTPEDPMVLSAMGAYTPGADSKLLFTMWPLTIVLGLSALLALISIFLYRNRPLQMRVCNFTALLLMSFWVFIFMTFILRSTVRAYNCRRHYLCRWWLWCSTISLIAAFVPTSDLSVRPIV